MHALGCFTVQITTPILSPMMTSSHISVTPTPAITGEGENAINYDAAILIAVTTV